LRHRDRPAAPAAAPARPKRKRRKDAQPVAGTTAPRTAGPGAGTNNGSSGGERLRRAIADLTEEVRALRLRRSETGAIRIAAMGVQLLAIMVAAIAFLNLADFENFVRWSAGAALLQLVTITILLFDRG
ncbi:MAG: hypothetical protein ACKO3W_08880, partial [bacterium]